MMARDALPLRLLGPKPDVLAAAQPSLTADGEIIRNSPATDRHDGFEPKLHIQYSSGWTVARSRGCADRRLNRARVQACRNGGPAERFAGNSSNSRGRTSKVAASATSPTGGFLNFNIRGHENRRGGRTTANLHSDVDLEVRPLTRLQFAPLACTWLRRTNSCNISYYSWLASASALASCVFLRDAP
jgi:hypothetical protein